MWKLEHYYFVVCTDTNTRQQATEGNVIIIAPRASV